VNPWVLSGAALLVGGLMTASYVKGHKNGVNEIRIAWESEKALLSQAQKKLILVNEAANEFLRRTQDEKNQKLAKEYQQRLALLRKDRPSADGSSLALGRLRDPGTVRACSALPTPTADSLGNNATAAGNRVLSEEAAKFLSSAIRTKQYFRGKGTCL